MSETPGTDLARPQDLESGLDDIEIADLVVPRLKIDHLAATFVENVSGRAYPEITGIILGLVKQRIMWHPTVDDKDKPMCKSPNYQTGFPTLFGNNGKTFPWDQSVFNEDDYPQGEDGYVRLPCEGCNFKDWGTSPNGKTPWCNEQHTYPILVNQGTDEEPEYVMSILSVSKSGIAPSRKYVTDFVRSKNGLYSAITKITLQQQMRGSNKYCTPIFRRVGNTEVDDWPEYSQQYRSMREFLTADPRALDDDSTGVNTAAAEREAPAKAQSPVKPPSPPKSSPTKMTPPATAVPEDDLPF